MEDLATHDESDQETDSERAEDGFGWVLADVVFSGHMDFLGFHAGFVPLLLSDFSDVNCFFRSDGFEVLGFFDCDSFELSGFLDSGGFEGVRRFDGTVFYVGCLFAGGFNEVIGRDSEVVS